MSSATRILKILGRVFAAIGSVALIVAAVIALLQALAIGGMQSTVGQVIAFQNRKPIVHFITADRQSVNIRGSIASTPPAYDIGQQLRVYYDPAGPQNAVIDSYLERWFVPTLVGGLGALFAVIGFGFLIFTFLRDRRIAWLRKNGTKIAGRIVDVAYNRYVQLNRKPTWQIVADWSANGMSGRALSFHLMQDPRPMIGDRTEIDVWIDPRNPDNAWVDTDFLDPRHAVAQAIDPVQRR